MKLVGEAMAKYYLKDNLNLLGISSFECTYKSEGLEVRILMD